LIPAADAGATVVGAGLSQRQLVQWSPCQGRLKTHLAAPVENAPAFERWGG
jgi:hypothetical protein